MGSYNVNIFTHSPSACLLFFIRAWANYPILQKNQKISTTYLIRLSGSNASLTQTDTHTSNQLPSKLISVMIDVNNVHKHRRKWSLYYLVALYVHIFIFESKIFETTFGWWTARGVLHLPCYIYIYCTGQTAQCLGYLDLVLSDIHHPS